MPPYLVVLVIVESLGLFCCFFIGAYLRYLGDITQATEAIGSLTPRAIVYVVVMMVALL